MNKPFEFVYVENDGTVRELDNEEIEYLQTKFEPTDGARPYVKSSYNQLTPDNKINGFLERCKVPNDIQIIETDLRYAHLKFPIYIFGNRKAIELNEATYTIKVLGGWSVSLGNFKIELKNKDTGEVIIPKITFWKIQSYESGEKAKKIMTFSISKKGIYLIEYKNQFDLTVRPSNLIIKRLSEKEIPNDQLRIWIG